jgi:hypothetical protein
MSENTKTDKTATVQSSTNKPVIPLVVQAQPSEINVVEPKMVILRKADDLTSGVGTFGGIISRSSNHEK